MIFSVQSIPRSPLKLLSISIPWPCWRRSLSSRCSKPEVSSSVGSEAKPVLENRLLVLRLGVVARSTFSSPSPGMRAPQQRLAPARSVIFFGCALRQANSLRFMASAANALAMPAVTITEIRAIAAKEYS